MPIDVVTNMKCEKHVGKRLLAATFSCYQPRQLSNFRFALEWMTSTACPRERPFKSTKSAAGSSPKRIGSKSGAGETTTCSLPALGPQGNSSPSRKCREWSTEGGPLRTPCSSRKLTFSQVDLLDFKCGRPTHVEEKSKHKESGESMLERRMLCSLSSWFSLHNWLI